MNTDSALIRRFEEVARSEAVLSHYMHLIRIALGLDPKATLQEIVNRAKLLAEAINS